MFGDLRHALRTRHDAERMGDIAVVAVNRLSAAMALLRMRVPPSTLCRLRACGFLPAAPVHLARSARAVSTPAGLLASGFSSMPAFSPFRAMACGHDSPLTVARAAAFRQFPFQPLRATCVCAFDSASALGRQTAAASAAGHRRRRAAAIAPTAGSSRARDAGSGTVAGSVKLGALKVRVPRASAAALAEPPASA